jgi:hypothetical protein
VILKFDAEYLNEVTPTFLGGRGPIGLKVSVGIQDIDAEDIIYKLWEHFGDDWMRSLLAKENYLFKKFEPKENK